MPRTDDTGVPNTCSIIDEIIQDADHIFNSLKVGDTLDAFNHNDYCSRLQGIMLNAEEVRTHNENLRAFALERHEEAEKLEDKIYDLEYENSRLEDLEDQIYELEKELSDTKYQLKQLKLYG